MRAACFVSSSRPIAGRSLPCCASHVRSRPKRLRRSADARRAGGAGGRGGAGPAVRLDRDAGHAPRERLADVERACVRRERQPIGEHHIGTVPEPAFAGREVEREDARPRLLEIVAVGDEEPAPCGIDGRIVGNPDAAAREALDLAVETEETRRLYGLDEPATADYGARCLIARRLVERGVRFVQVFTGNQTWDHHGSIRKGLPKACTLVDKPTAALVRDLKRRGLLETTLVHWGGEMGRLPVIQNDAGPDKVGRDHNTYGFSMWLAGGGVRGGMTHGATDEFGFRAVENKVHVHDLHATLLHLLGFDHEKLTYRYAGRDFRLTDVHGQVVKPVLA